MTKSKIAPSKVSKTAIKSVEASSKVSEEDGDENNLS